MHLTNDTVVSWIKERAIPITTLDPQAPLDDLVPLEQIVGNVTIVGLGEASHGGREFFLMKHRLLRFLVEKMGFTLFAMEMSWMRAKAINEYILTGAGDSREALKNHGFWVWNTQEVLDLIEWMRAYNADPQHTQKVHFAGFDCQSLSATGLDTIVHYFQKVDPQHATQVANLYKDLYEIDFRDLPDPPIRQQYIEAADQVYAILQEHEIAYIALSSPQAFAQALQEAQVVKQTMQVIMDSDAAMYSDEYWTIVQQRDLFMAENIHWLHEHAPGGAKMVLWAHNWHIGTLAERRHDRSGKVLLPFNWMGVNLRQRYREHYLTIGFSFFEGSHNAILFNKDGIVLPRQIRVHTIVPASQESYHSTLAKAGQLYLLDLRSLPAGEVSDWFDGPQAFRDYGAEHMADDDNYQDVSLSAWFDAIIQVDKISPTQLLPR
jgi:erythromycin esterase